MGFYEQISKYYDYIFPTSGESLKFIRDAAGIPGKRVLDVACGSGGYAVKLAEVGYDVTAVDLDHEMVRLAKDKADARGIPARILQCDMRELKTTLEGQYDCIFCIGNSIVHLGTLEEIRKVLEQMYSMLEPEGVLVLQIINYDRIIKYRLTELPTVRNGEIELEFIRKYEYDDQMERIHFHTILTVGHGESKEKYDNTVELLPLRSQEMRMALTDVGFGRIHFYSDFNHSPYHEDAYMLVVKAVK